MLGNCLALFVVAFILVMYLVWKYWKNLTERKTKVEALGIGFGLLAFLAGALCIVYAWHIRRYNNGFCDYCGCAYEPLTHRYSATYYICDNCHNGTWY